MSLLIEFVFKMEVQYSDLEMGDRIGQGACSSVNLARHKKTKEIYAIKLFNVCDQAQESQLFNEIFLLTSFQCDALIALKGAFHDQGCIGVILEYMDKGSLEFIMERSVGMAENVMAAISFQIIWGLGYLHYEKQIHRDIKPANILMVSAPLAPSAVLTCTELEGAGEVVGLRHLQRAGQLHCHVAHRRGLLPVHVS